jgi:hypothetical protein
MVLSLGFILAFIGAAVALLIGILIFSEVSDAIICPSAGGSGNLFNTLQESSDGTSFQSGGWQGQIFPTSGESITSVTVNGIVINTGSGTLKSQIYTGATTDIDTSTLLSNSSNTLVIAAPNPNFNFTWNFAPAVVVNDPDTYVSLLLENFDSDIGFKTSTVDVSIGDGIKHTAVETAGFVAVLGGGDMLMWIQTSGGGGSGQGNAECESAKDTAWTVIGILPVALFFALFAIFGALGGRQ